MNNNMNLPANCAMMNDDEMMNVSGGSAIETAFKAVIAIGGAVALTGVAAVAAKGILSIFGGAPVSGSRILSTAVRTSLMPL